MMRDSLAHIRNGYLPRELTVLHPDYEVISFSAGGFGGPGKVRNSPVLAEHRPPKRYGVESVSTGSRPLSAAC